MNLHKLVNLTNINSWYKFLTSIFVTIFNIIVSNNTRKHLFNAYQALSWDHYQTYNLINTVLWGWLLSLNLKKWRHRKKTGFEFRQSLSMFYPLNFFSVLPFLPWPFLKSPTPRSNMVLLPLQLFHSCWEGLQAINSSRTNLSKEGMEKTEWITIELKEKRSIYYSHYKLVISVLGFFGFFFIFW